MVDALGVLLAGMGAAGILLVVFAAMLGGVAQATVGFGAAFATVPALALVAPQLLPGTMLVAALPLTAVMAFVERRRLDRPGALRLVAARLPGILLGTWVVVVVDVRILTLVVGVVLLAAVAASALGWHVRVTPLREWGAGIVSGITGAATALGGPPLALLYRDRDPAVLRPTLAVVWAVGLVMTIGSLAVVGEFTAIEATTGVVLSAAVLLGLLLSRLLLTHVAPSTIRAAILWWAAVGGVAAVLRALFS